MREKIFYIFFFIFFDQIRIRVKYKCDCRIILIKSFVYFRFNADYDRFDLSIGHSIIIYVKVLICKELKDFRKKL